MLYRFFAGILFFLFFLETNQVFSQTDSGKLEDNKIFQSELNIVNGEKWNYHSKYKGHPFWRENTVFTGDVNYNGQLYENLNFKFNLVNQELILFQQVEGQNKIYELNRKFIDTFKINNSYGDGRYQFVRRRINGEAAKRFFQQVYTGESQCYIFHKKSVIEKIRGEYMGRYTYHPVIYIKKNHAFAAFDNNRSFLRLFDEHKKVLRRYMRKNSLSIDAEKPDEIARILKFYDSLNQQSKPDE